MYANLYGTEGVEKMAQLMKKEILLDAVNLGVKSLDELDTSYVSVPITSSLTCDGECEMVKTC